MNALAALEPFVRAWRAVAPPQERCGVCGHAIDDEHHEHLIDLEKRALLCSCTACSTVFAQEGTALVDGAFTVTNADFDEQLFTRVTLQNPTSGARPRPARVYLGPLARAKVAPEAVLLTTDTQVATMIGTTSPDVPIVNFRSLQRPFRVGGNAVFAFPKHFVGGQWAVENGDLTARWIALPDFARFDFTARTPTRSHELDVSPAFIDMLDDSKLTLDTTVPGYQREWRIDLAGPYDRRLVTFKGSGTGVVAISELSERVNMGQAVAPALDSAMD